MRVIAGSARGHHLSGPPRGAATRPTSDKVREALFNVIGSRVIDARVLDLFAGTGALGIEALSRGAAHATMVESDRGLCEVIRKNLAHTKLGDRATVLTRDVRRVAPALAPEAPFDLVFADPPYDLGHEASTLALLETPGLLATDADVYLEHRAGTPAPPSARLRPMQTREYGDTAITSYVAYDPTPSTVMTRIAIYPGSFDPLTNGHLDVIQRSLLLFDRLVIAVARNVRKSSLFSVEERIELIREVLGDDGRVEIDTFEGLLVEYAKRKGAVALVRGLRAVADFEYEFEMASMNRRLAPQVETVFLMTHENYFYVSSHLVKEVATLGGNIDAFVPPPVAARLRTRIQRG